MFIMRGDIRSLDKTLPTPIFLDRMSHKHQSAKVLYPFLVLSAVCSLVTVINILYVRTYVVH